MKPNAQEFRLCKLRPERSNGVNQPEPWSVSDLLGFDYWVVLWPACLEEYSNLWKRRSSPQEILVYSSRGSNSCTSCTRTSGTLESQAIPRKCITLRRISHITESTDPLMHLCNRLSKLESTTALDLVVWSWLNFASCCHAISTFYLQMISKDDSYACMEIKI